MFPYYLEVIRTLLNTELDSHGHATFMQCNMRLLCNMLCVFRVLKHSRLRPSNTGTMKFSLQHAVNFTLQLTMHFTLQHTVNFTLQLTVNFTL